MATDSAITKSNAHSRSGPLSIDSENAADKCRRTSVEIIKSEASLCRDLNGLSFTKSLVRVVSDKFKKKRSDLGACNGEERMSGSGTVSSRCLSLYINAGGCRVGACEDLDVSFSAIEECLPRRTNAGVAKAGADCLSYGVNDKFSKKNLRKGKSIEQTPSNSDTQCLLPDDVMEMILAQLPTASVIAARGVCRKWKYLTTTPHFMQIRRRSSSRTPWLFLFGITRDGSHPGEVHALDVSLGQWHRISNRNLRRRFLFSVASTEGDIYIVGGCSDSSFSMDKGSVKTHKGVLVFSPLTGSWRKAARMRFARSRPVVGVFEVDENSNIFNKKPSGVDCPTHRFRAAAVTEVCEHPSRFPVRRRRLRDAFFEDDDSPEYTGKPSDVEQTENHLRFGLIAVGGYGCWDEPLESCEVYDPATDRWMDIPNLPGDFGTVCSGAVCGRMFYVLSMSDKLAAYDLERGFWTTIQTSRLPAHLHEYAPELVCCRGRLFLLAVSWCERVGQSNRRDKAARKLWELDLELTTWNEVSVHPDAPMDCHAAFVADNVCIYGVEMFGIFGQVLDFVTACHVSDTENKWSHVSKKHAAHDADAASCKTKSIVVLNL